MTEREAAIQRRYDLERTTGCVDFAKCAIGDVGFLLGETARLRARLADALDALKPFAKCAEKLDAESKYPDEYQDAEPCAFQVQPTLRSQFSDFTVGDLRRAARVLASGEEPPR